MSDDFSFNDKTFYEKQVHVARAKVKQIFETDTVLGVKLYIRRGHNDIQFGPPNHIGDMVGVPDGNRKYLVEPITVDTDAYLQLQFRASEGMWGHTDDYQRFISGAYEPTVQFVHKAIVNKNLHKIPTPVLEIKENGRVSQERRSRTLGAQRAQLARIPVWLAQQIYR